jgi:hypothetical protein
MKADAAGRAGIPPKRVAAPWPRRANCKKIAASMDTRAAEAIAERALHGARDEGGEAVIEHVRRVGAMVPAEASAVAWLHEVLECSAVSEQELLMAGLSTEELRALRLLSRAGHAHSDRAYLAQLELIARSAGESGRLARLVKVADLHDRCGHPRVRSDGWAPPYRHALHRLQQGSAAGLAAYG